MLYRHRLIIIVLLVLGALGPLLLYALTLGRAPSVTPEQAQQMLNEPRTVLVDVSSPKGTVPLRNGTPLPLPSLLQYHSPQDLPPTLRDRTILLLCPGGIQSAQAALHLQSIGVTHVFAVRGGEQEWLATTPDCPAAVRFRPASGMSGLAGMFADLSIPAFRHSPPYEQFLVVLTFFGFKFIYTLLSGALVVLLWKRTAPDLAALRWSMLAFFIGENFCFINVMVFFEDSQLLEHLHSVGMIFTFAFAVWAMLEFFDARLIHVSDSSRCAAVGLCRGCIKQNTAPCGSRRMFLLLIPATALLALLPLCSSFRHLTYNTRIFGALHAYRHPAIHQLYELRVLPVIALILLVCAFFVLLFRERHPTPISKILFSAAAGALGFSYFRLLLVAAFIDNQVWFVAWEETTELMFVAFVGAILWLFRRSLLAPAQTFAE